MVETGLPGSRRLPIFGKEIAIGIMQNIYPEQDSKQEESKPRHSYGAPLRDNNVIVGVVLVLIGALVLTKMIFNFTLPNFIIGWPTILMVVGLLIGLRHRFTGHAWWILLAIGIFFFIDKNIIGLGRYRSFLPPVLIMMAGILFILRRRSYGPVLGRRRRGRHRFAPGQQPFTTPQGVVGDDVLDMTNILGSSKQYIVSQHFKGGRITSILGSSEVNMTQSNFENQVVIDLVTVMGGTEIIVPANWRIVNQITAILGGIDDKRRFVPSQDYTKTVILQGTVLLGGVDLKSY